MWFDSLYDNLKNGGMLRKHFINKFSVNLIEIYSFPSDKKSEEKKFQFFIWISNNNWIPIVCSTHIYCLILTTYKIKLLGSIIILMWKILRIPQRRKYFKTEATLYQWRTWRSLLPQSIQWSSALYRKNLKTIIKATESQPVSYYECTLIVIKYFSQKWNFI